MTTASVFSIPAEIYVGVRATLTFSIRAILDLVHDHRTRLETKTGVMAPVAGGRYDNAFVGEDRTEKLGDTSSDGDDASLDRKHGNHCEERIVRARRNPEVAT